MNLKNTILLVFFVGSLPLAKAQWEIKNIDANNINAPVEADGFLFRNTITDQSFEVPKFSGKYCIYASNLWMAGLDQNGILHVGAQTYKQNGTDFWPGPLVSNGSTLPASLWDKVWHIDRTAIQNHIDNYNTQGYQMPQDIIDWPGSTYNGINQIFAPFADINNNGIYDPSYGDYPNVLGDEVLYVMYNDKFSSHGESLGIPVEAEIYSTVYAYNSTGSNILDHTVFVRHRIRNRSQLNTYSNFYVGIWNDFDIGSHNDDMIGTDINRNMVYGYNADNFDTVYGNNPPAACMKILNHPLHNSMFYDHSGTTFYGNNPTSPNHYYNYVRSIWKDDMPLNYGLEGYQTGQGSTGFCFSGNTNPDFTTAWEMTSPKDNCIIGSAGPFTIAPNGYITIDVAYIYARGTQGNSVNELGIAADVVQNFYSATINGWSEENTDKNISFYPNPCHDFLILNCNYTFKSEATVTLYHITGAVLNEEQTSILNKHRINTEDLESGVYFIGIKTEKGIQRFKFVKQ